jgi:hypothetical protein
MLVPIMTAAIGIALAVLSILPFLGGPTRAIAKGGVWVYVGAAMLVGIMMMTALSLSSPADDTKSDSAQLTKAETDALDKLFR